MSLYKLTPDDFEFFTLETNPKREYASSSLGGITGSVNLFARRSTVEKDIFSPLNLMDSIPVFKDESLDAIRQIALQSTASNISNEIDSYLSYVRNIEQTTRNQKKLEIYRFNPPFSFNSNFLRKSFIRTTLMPSSRTIYPRASWNVTNYNTLNFFTSSTVPEDSVLLYPNPVLDDGIGSNYQISGSFAFDFFIKPKYTTKQEGVEYKPGSIMHLSNSYCISLHSGSSKDLIGLPDKFRLAVQLGDDASVLPSDLDLTSTPITPFTFFSTDNSLPINSWSHVTVTWAGHDKNNGSGSIYINAVKDSSFIVTESLLLGHYTGSRDPSVLCIGNFYEGENDLFSSMDRFFAADPSLREGLVELNGTVGIEEPVTYDFTHPLNAEIHEIKLYDKYLTKSEVQNLQTNAPQFLSNIRFYLPPFFTEESPYRQNVGTFGGELVTPFFEKDATTTTPFAAQMAFSGGGHYINLENYVRDFATGNYPRLWALSGSAWTPPSTTILSANDFLYATGSIIKRLYQILPCDNGGFQPNFGLLSNLSQSMFVNDLGNSELGVVTLNNLVSDDYDGRSIVTSGSMLNDVLGSQPDNLTALPGNSLAILHRTRDSSSNQVVIFDISNMFYGMAIKPKTLIIRDSSPKFAGFPITIKDDGEGNLYRADCVASSSTVFNPHPTWASIGNVFYDEGLVVIKSPQLYFFGEEQFEIEFKGEQNIHVYTVNAFARTMNQTSSSNPSYMPIPNVLANESDSKSVYITGINIHDENLNVVMRTNLASPVLKKSSDKILFKIKLDF